MADSLGRAGVRAQCFSFAPGEDSKSLATYGALMEFLAESQLTRAGAVVAVGGGVVGDLAGFAAATYLRGVRFVQVPTTLLAVVDSSVGGKTAVNLAAGRTWRARSTSHPWWWWTWARCIPCRRKKWPTGFPKW